MPVTATLYKGDCLDIVKSIDRRTIAAIVSDPPYGVAVKTDNSRFSGGKAAPRTRLDRARIRDDHKPFNPTPWLVIPKIVLWGANFYSDNLPLGGWLIWCKKRDNQLGTVLGDCEVAWTNTSKAVYLKRHVWNGFDRESERHHGVMHASQKPIAIMGWCIDRLRLSPGDTIIDPYMGSGTTGVAAINRGFNFVGIEIDPEYYAIAQKRVLAARDAFNFRETL
jgi:site-specific DNA-methyltransferase (adenine-specific)